MNKEEIIENIFEKIEKEENLLELYKSFPSTVPGNPNTEKGLKTSFPQTINVSQYNIQQLEKKLSKLYKLLDKVNSSGFGTCRKCGKSILTGDLGEETGHDLCRNCAK